MGLSAGLFLPVLVAYLGLLLYLGRRLSDRTMILAIILTTIVAPIGVLLGMFGMCAVHGFRM